ncbi:MAG: hypothetical protein IT319_01545 [Anaerolineae bacterium]|nr:hypothetical protein [Anaerolineae bacterium]
MMYQRLEEALSRLIGEQKPIKGTLGYTIDGTYRVLVVEDAAQYYVRFADGSFAQVYHRGRVSPVPELPVEVGFDSAGNMAILGGDPDRAGLFEGAHEVGPHSHAHGSGMEFDIDPRLLTPVKAAPLAGLTVEVAQGAYRYQGALRWWSGGTITLTPPGSAHTWAWVEIGLDPETEALVSASGSPVVVSAPLEPSTIPVIALTGAIPLAAVRVRNGQTELDEADFEDLRCALVDIPAALDDLNDVDTGGASDGDVLTYDSGIWMPQAPSGGSGSIDVSDGITTISPADTLTADSDYFEINDLGSGNAELTLRDGGVGGVKLRYVARKLYDNTLSAAGRWDVANANLIAGAGNFADYDRVELYLFHTSTTASGSEPILALLNGDSTAANYGAEYLTVTSSATATGVRNDTAYIGAVNGTSSPAGYVTNIKITLHEPGSNAYKTLFSESSWREGSTTHIARHYDLQWENTAAVTQITLQPASYSTGKFAAGSRLVIVGYKQEALGAAVEYSAANVSSPPTDAELDSAFGQPGDVGAGFVGIVNDNGGGTGEYVCWSDGTNWFYAVGTKAI